MNEKWRAIIDLISVVKPECVNVEKVLMMLDFDRNADTQVLDNLYILGVLSLEEYTKRMVSKIEWMKKSIYWEEERLKSAEEKGKNYNPMIFYGLGRTYLGAGIENGLKSGGNDR